MTNPLISLVLSLLKSLAIAIAVPFIILTYRVLNPTILKFPWPEIGTDTNLDAGAGKDTRTKTKPQTHNDDTIVFAGSFNPPHNGHLAMVKYLARKHKQVILVIGMNPSKKYKVSPADRAAILERMVASIGLGKESVRVKVVSGYIWRYAMSTAVNAKILYRGIRTWEKDGKEERALHILNSWGPIVFGPLKWPLVTNFMEGDTKYLHLSSTLIREACLSKDKDLSGMVPKQVEDDIVKAYT